MIQDFLDNAHVRLAATICTFVGGVTGLVQIAVWLVTLVRRRPLAQRPDGVGLGFLNKLAEISSVLLCCLVLFLACSSAGSWLIFVPYMIILDGFASGISFFNICLILAVFVLCFYYRTLKVFFMKIPLEDRMAYRRSVFWVAAVSFFGSCLFVFGLDLLGGKSLSIGTAFFSATSFLGFSWMSWAITEMIWPDR